MVNLVWSTPDGDNLIAKLARVSNPSNEDNNETAPRLIRYLIKHKHWSPFEMVSACVEIKTTRDIGRQILRHRSFSFQEFSQRYAEIAGEDIILRGIDENNIGDKSIRHIVRPGVRLQDEKNRQNSIPVDDPVLNNEWDTLQWSVWLRAVDSYKKALSLGIAKELARALLPEGLTPTRLYMAGTLRSWIHYLDVRMGKETQLEHRHIAEEIHDILRVEFPSVFCG